MIVLGDWYFHSTIEDDPPASMAIFSSLSLHGDSDIGFEFLQQVASIVVSEMLEGPPSTEVSKEASRVCGCTPPATMFRVRRMVLLLTLCASSVVAFKDHEFKTCDTNPFCKRYDIVTSTQLSHPCRDPHLSDPRNVQQTSYMMIP